MVYYPWQSDLERLEREPGQAEGEARLESGEWLGDDLIGPPYRRDLTTETGYWMGEEEPPRMGGDPAADSEGAGRGFVPFGWNDQTRSRKRRGAHYGKGPKGFTVSDERLMELIWEALRDHDDIDPSGLSFDVQGGEVTLTGTVEDLHMKFLVEQAVSEIMGVKDVNNRLGVRRRAGI